MFHIRFTPYDISGYTFDFLNQHDRFILARETKDKKGNDVSLHYHIYVETTYGEKSLRDAIKSSLKVPAAGRGKNNAYYALQSKWKDPAYVCKYDDIVKSKGFTEAEILELVISGRKKYLVKVEESPDGPAASANKIRAYWDREVTADAITYFELAKKSGNKPSNLDLMMEINRLTRTHTRGINPYKSRDIFYSVLHDTGDAELVAKKCLALL